MKWLTDLARKLRVIGRQDRFDADLAEEMRLHLDLRAEKNEARGMSRDDARAAARRQFGNTAQLQERSRQAWGWGLLDTLRQDLRYAARTLAANPGFTATVIFSLALGIGANTAIFTIINAVILRSLPVEDPHELVQISPGGDGSTTNPIWEHLRDNQRTFSGMLAYADDRFDLASGGESQFAQGLWVSGDFFRVLGVPALQGRVFTTEDDKHGGGSQGPVAVISYKFWKRNFGGTASPIGKIIRLDRHQFEIVGVTPPWFKGLDVDHSYDVAIPLGCYPVLRSDTTRAGLDNPAFWWLRILGRRATGQTLEQASAQIKALSPAIFRATVPDFFPAEAQKNYLQNTLVVTPAETGFSNIGSRYKTALYTIMATVGLVLLIACANIANLLLARASARQRELTVRMAIGASRSRVIRQLLTESLLLAACGTAGGFLFAIWGSRVLLGWLSTTGNPLEIDLSPDTRVLAFTIGVALLTALLFGLAPALKATRVELNDIHKENARTMIGGSGRLGLSKVLVSCQVALSLMLLVGASLFLATLRNILTIDPGFRADHTMLVRVDASQSSLPPTQLAESQDEILARVRSLPGVASASSVMIVPISGSGWGMPVEPEGMPSKPPRDRMVFLNLVSTDYFRTMRTPLLAGRDFNDHDTASSQPVMILGETTARQFFANENPLGKTIRMDKLHGERGETELYQVIGVVKDTRYGRMNEDTRRTAFVTRKQAAEPEAIFRLVIHYSGADDMVIPSIRSAIGGVNRGFSLEFRDFATQVSESISQPRIVAWLSAGFGALALLLAMVGLYGVTAYGVARRRGEIGIRMALGARSASVTWLVLRDVLLLVAAGLAIGLGASAAAGRLIAALLYGVEPTDPLQIATAAAALIVATAIAAYLPARRAARLDPMAALREE